MWYKQLGRHWNKTKSFIHQGYHTLGKWAGEIDRAAGIGRKIFSLAAPILDDLGQGDAIRRGVKAFQGYDDARRQVLDVDQQVRGHAQRIGAADIF